MAKPGPKPGKDGNGDAASSGRKQGRSSLILLSTITLEATQLATSPFPSRLRRPSSRLRLSGVRFSTRCPNGTLRCLWCQ